MPSLYKRRTRGGKLSSHWWARWKDHRGKRCVRSIGTANEVAAQTIANDWETDDALARHGRREHVDRRSIEQLMVEYKGKLAAGDNTATYVEETLRMIRAVCTAEGLTHPAQICPERVE